MAGAFDDDDTVPEVVCTQVFDSTSALEGATSSSMEPGTSLCLADGEYDSLELSFGGDGTADNPITVAAENPGQVTISGEAKVQMGGSYAVLQGLIFKGGTSASTNLISTRLGSGNECSHCRITEVSIVDVDSGGDDTGKWVYDYGEYTRIDHCWFAGKTSRGALLVVDRWTDDPSTAQVDYARIDHNYFGDRAPTEGKAYADSGDNEYEAIRIGLSTTHRGDSYSVVAHNYFERIDGEAEIISNKATNNSIVHNTVRDSYGSITNRHGSNTTIANNFMFGDGHPFAGGLRIVDGGHTVVNNYIEGARYKATTHHGGIVLMGSDSSPGDSGYQQFENVLVAHNTVVDSVNSLNVDGGKKSNNPKDAYLVNNIIADAIGPVITQAADGMPGGSTEIAGNIFYGDAYSDDDAVADVDGILFMDTRLERGDDGLWRPGDDSPNLDAVTANTGNFGPVTTDMDGQERDDTTQAGADHIAGTHAASFPLTREMVGPKSYTPPESIGPVKRVPIANDDFDNDQDDWSFLGSASIVTEEAFSRHRSAKVESDGQFSQAVTLQENTNYTLSAFAKGTGELHVELSDGTAFTGETLSDGFEFTSVSFNSGSNTEAIIGGRLPETMEVIVDLQNPHFDDDVDVGWTTVENSGDNKETQGIGDVGDSSNNASSDDASGSAKIGYRYAADEGGTPGIYQDVSGLVPDTEYTLSMYLLVKSESSATATFGVKDPSDESIIMSKSVDYDELKNGGAEESAEDSYYKAIVTFNSGSLTSVRVYAEVAPQLIADNPGPPAELDSDTRKMYELRVDDFELSYEGAPPEGAEAVFDGFRLVSHKSL